ncbi:LysO family transporter [Phocaeicola plebeius]|uniref:LysO family transporter n=1 Tax=Phocaeicola plebeius TaxID=310297 RepID=UPI0035654627
MFTFISIMAVGVLIGYPLRRKQSIHKIPVQIVVCLLLFILGLSIGTNKLIIGNLSYFCQQAAIISMLSLLGSSVAALLVSHFFFKKGANREG